MTVKKSLIFYFFLFFIIQILQIFYFQRSSFLSTYDVLYWKDRFEHSQWKLPLSKRIIGDDGLFSYVGYNLAKGADPSLINPETQPVGKYLIGFSILFFKNSSFYSLIFGFLSLTFFYILARKLLKDKVISVFILLVLFFGPLIF